VRLLAVEEHFFSVSTPNAPSAGFVISSPPPQKPGAFSFRLNGGSHSVDGERKRSLPDCSSPGTSSSSTLASPFVPVFFDSLNRLRRLDETEWGESGFYPFMTRVVILLVP